MINDKHIWRNNNNTFNFLYSSRQIQPHMTLTLQETTTARKANKVPLAKFWAKAWLIELTFEYSPWRRPIQTSPIPVTFFEHSPPTAAFQHHPLISCLSALGCSLIPSSSNCFEKEAFQGAGLKCLQPY